MNEPRINVPLNVVVKNLAFIICPNRPDEREEAEYWITQLIARLREEQSSEQS